MIMGPQPLRGAFLLGKKAQVSLEVLFLLSAILALAVVVTYLAKTFIYGTTTTLNQTINVTGEKLR